jgi:predicted Zn finger-like uncharacterized protein
MLIVCPKCETSYEVKPESLGETGRKVRCAKCQEVWFASRPPSDDDAFEAAFEEIGGAAFDEGAAALKSAARPAAAQPRTEEDAAGDWGVPDFAPNSPSPPLAPTNDEMPAFEAATALDAEPPPRRDIESAAAVQSAPARRRRGSRPELQAVPIIIAVEIVLILAILIWRTDVVRMMPQTASFFRMFGLSVNLRGLAFSNVHLAKDEQNGVRVLTVEGEIQNTTRSTAAVPRLRFALRNAAKAELVSWTAPPEQTSLGPGQMLEFRSRLAAPPSDVSDITVRFLNRADLTDQSR